MSTRTDKTYRVWAAMIQRCTNPNQPHYPIYGGRGITVCSRWRVFANFLADMGERPQAYSIDRINNNGNYEPQNCRWVDRRTQNNNRRDNRRITFNGQTHTYAEWERLLGLTSGRVHARIASGWPIERVLAEMEKT